MFIYIYMVISVQVNVHVGVNIYIYIYIYIDMICVMWDVEDSGERTFNEEADYIGKVVGVDVIMFLEVKAVEFSTRLLA
jgi:hypothetical protein